VGQFAVAALSERRNSSRIQNRRSETAATKTKLTHYLIWVGVSAPHGGDSLRGFAGVRENPEADFRGFRTSIPFFCDLPEAVSQLHSLESLLLISGLQITEQLCNLLNDAAAKQLEVL